MDDLAARELAAAAREFLRAWDIEGCSDGRRYSRIIVAAEALRRQLARVGLTVEETAEGWLQARGLL